MHWYIGNRWFQHWHVCNILNVYLTGETVLVTAAAGGTGQFAVQLAKLAGCHVIGTCSSPQKAQLLTELGCDRVVNYNEEKLADVLKNEYKRGMVQTTNIQAFMNCVHLAHC